MGKGLPRSLSRGNPLKQEIIKQSIEIDASLSFTGATGVIVRQQAVIGDFPEGNILFLGATAYLKLTGPTSANLTNDFEGDFSVGTVPNADTDLADAGEADIIASTAIGPATAEATAVTRGVGGGTLSGVIFDNTDGSLEINLNVLLDADEVTDAQTVAIRAQGVLHIAYIMLGDD